MEKALMRARAGELRGGQSHTVEIVVFIVFATLIAAFFYNKYEHISGIKTIFNTAINLVQGLLPPG